MAGSQGQFLRTERGGNKYVLRAVGCFPGPHLAKRFYRSAHKLKQYS